MRTLIMGGLPVALAFLAALGLPVNSISQTVTTTAYPAIYYSGNPTIPVDPNITITSLTPVTNVRVTITQNFSSGDVLNYNGTLPAGVTSSYNATLGELLFTGTATAAEWQTLLQTVTFYTSSTSTDNRNVTFSIGNLIAGSNGHFYEYVPFANAASIQTWKQAKDAAAAASYYGLQGYLATITSQEENDILFQRLSASGWIGSTDDYQQINAATGTTTYANQTASEGNWYWVTGPEAGTQFSQSPWPGATPTVINNMYNNWSSSEPNNNWNTTQNGETGEQYGEIYAGTSPWGQPGKWNDFYNLNSDMDFVQGYIVEYGGMPGDPSVTLASNRTLIFTSILAATNLHLNAVGENSGIKLTWLANAKATTDSFIVLHSTDGINFYAKGSVAAGNLISYNNYSWIDSRAGNKANYYRIKSVNKDGTYSLSGIVSIFNKSTAKMWCFPNPVKKGGSVTVNIQSDKVQTARITLAAIYGMRINEMRMNLQVGVQSATFAIDQLAAGIYFIGIQDQNGNYIGDLRQLIVK